LDCRRAADECDEFAPRHNHLPIANRLELLSTYQRAARAAEPLCSTPAVRLIEAGRV
jgi:hypothetical protein